MSDRPQEPTNPISDEPKTLGGWRKPSERGAWQLPASPREETEGWRVPAMPTDLTVEPEAEGVWHLPRPEDTMFSPEDQIDITPERVEEIQSRPEDMLLELETADGAAASQPTDSTSSAALPSDDSSDEPTSEAQTASGELGSLLALESEGGDTQEDDELEDEDAFSMSELIALSSLVENQAAPDIVPTGDVVAASPAERALYGGTGTVAAIDTDESPTGADDPADYARRQLEKLSGTGAQSAVSATGPSIPVQSSVDDPADYARRQLEQLGVGGTGAAAPVTTGTGAMPAASLTSEQQELSRRFRETEEQVRVLRARFQAGEITREDLQARLRQLMILDDDRTWWMMGVETDRWYKFDNGDWVIATPPFGTGAQAPVSDSQRVAPPTETSGLSASQVIHGSIPYFASEQVQPGLDVTQATGVGFGTPVPSGVYGDTEQMPLPQNVPVQDPDYTVVGRAGAYLDPVRQSDANTIPSFGVGAGETIVNPRVTGFDVQPGGDVIPGIETAPDYNLEGVAPTYEQYAERQRGRTVSNAVRLLLVGIGLLLVMVACGLGYVLVTYNNIAAQYQPQIAALANYQPAFQTVRVLDRNGNLIAEINSQQGGARTDVPLNQISPFMIHAVVALENETFFSDPGWDWGTIGVAIVSQGGQQSATRTITQQLAEQLVLRTPTTPALRLDEAIIAAEIAKQYTKEQILELYLNEIYFGNQAYGVEAASQFYFSHSAADLNLAEAAMLAGMITNPVQFNPVRTGEDTSESYNARRESVFDRMDVVINQMQRVGCLSIPGAPPSGFCVDALAVRQAAAQKAQVETLRYETRQVRYRYPHFVQFIQAQVERLFPSQMFQRGFVITTTLDPTIQDAADQALDQQLLALATTGVNTGSIMVTDPRTGAILAMIGSPDFYNADIEGQVNGALTWQQPGPVIKPIVYLGALEGLDRNGDGVLDYMTPSTVLWDVPTSFQNPNFTPANLDGQFWGPLGVRYALQNSRNVPVVKAYEFIGTPKFQDVAGRLGLNFMENAQFGFQTALGATEVTLYDMMVAYGAIANNGVRAPLFAIQGITDAGGTPIVLPDRAAPAQVIQQPVNYLLQSILSDDTARAQAFGQNGPLTIQGLPTGGYVGAFTGASDQNRDLWTMGFTRNAVVGVWLGRPDNQPTFVQGGGYQNVAPLWNAVMLTTLGKQGRPEGLNPPGNGSVVQAQICTDTGTLPPSNCTNLRPEVFVQNQPPPSSDQAFVQQVAIDTWTGLRANNFCPDNSISGTYVNISDASAVAWLQTPAGLPVARRLGLTGSNLETVPSASCDTNTDVPIARIISPTEGQPLTGLVQVTGAASAATFNRYQIEVALTTSPNNFTIVSGPTTTPQTSGILGQWDTTRTPNGTYIVRLAVFSNSGGYLYRTVTVIVNNLQPTAIPTVGPLVVPTSPFDQPTTQFVQPTSQPFGSTPIPFDPVTVPPP